MSNLQALLLVFEAISGLKVNLTKSKMVVMGEVSNLQRLADILGCSMISAQGTYLRLPLGGRLKSKHIWDPVIQWVDHRRVRWKGCYLLKGGRLTPMKSGLSNLAVYEMSLFPVPSSILHQLEKIRSDFLWHTEEGNQKIIWLSKITYTSLLGWRARNLGIR